MRYLRGIIASVTYIKLRSYCVKACYMKLKLFESWVAIFTEGPVFLIHLHSGLFELCSLVILLSADHNLTCSLPRVIS